MQSARASGGKRGFDFGIFGGEEYDEEEVHKENEGLHVMNVDEDEFDYPQRLPARDGQS